MWLFSFEFVFIKILVKMEYLFTLLRVIVINPFTLVLVLHYAEVWVILVIIVVRLFVFYCSQLFTSLILGHVTTILSFYRVSGVFCDTTKKFFNFYINGIKSLTS